jgi:uncharacterized protein (TIGR03437 family)
MTGAVASAQPGFDNSGTGNVVGDYFVREVFLSDIDQTTSAIVRALSIVGVMTFDGQGNYSFTGQKMDTRASGPVNVTGQLGQYAVASNGFVALQDPLDLNQFLFGGAGASGNAGPIGLVASLTEGPHRCIFIALPAGSSFSTANVQGAYNAAFIDFLDADASKVRDGSFTLSTSGNGSFGNVSVNGAMANQGSQDVTQNFNGVTYNITGSEGSGTILFPVASDPESALISGQKNFYFSAYGYWLAGDPAGFDIMVGIPALTSSASNSLYQGTYYIAGLENDASRVSSGQNNIDAFYGSIFSLGQGTTITHLRYAPFNQPPLDYTYDPAPYNLASDGSFSDGPLFGMLGDAGNSLLEVGTGAFYSLTPAFSAGQYQVAEPFLDPLKVWNAATFAPITNAVAPGEFVSLFGSGLANSPELAQSLPLPTTLGGVQVSIDGVLAPIDYVSPNQINVLVPYGAAGNQYAVFQVSNNGAVSNAVTVYQSPTAPGVFTSTNGGFAPGVGPAAALHADFSAVTKSNPAKIGETLQLFVTGLGAVTPAVADGAAAPSSPLSLVDADVGIQVDGISASVTFKGLTPGYAGLYQVNFVMPDGVSSGLVALSVSTPDAQTVEAKLYVQ